jgi:hypothetical protein
VLGTAHSSDLEAVCCCPSMATAMAPSLGAPCLCSSPPWLLSNAGDVFCECTLLLEIARDAATVHTMYS